MKTNGENGTGVPRGARVIFGIFMILFYIGIGLFFILYTRPLFFDRAVTSVIGGILIAYGIWRGIRLFLGRN